MPTGINIIDKEWNRGLNIALQNNSKSGALRVIMTMARWRLNEYGEQSLVIMPGLSALDTIYKKCWGTLKANSQLISQNYNFDNDMTRFELKNPLTPGKAAINRIDEALVALGGRPANIFLLFNDPQNDGVWLELKYLQSKYNLTMIAAVPKIDYLKPFNTHYEFNEASTDHSLKIVKSYSLGIPQPAEVFSYDADGYCAVSKNSAGAIAQFTIAQVTAELYDLRSFAEQQAHPDKLKALLIRYQELNPNGPKRPKFMQ